MDKKSILGKSLLLTLLAFTVFSCGKSSAEGSESQTNTPETNVSVLDKINARTGTLLLVCGSNMVYLIDADAAAANGYKSSVLWQWNATTAASTLHLDASRLNHLDDCKPVDRGRKLLITSSYNWAVLLDIETKKILWYSKESKKCLSFMTCQLKQIMKRLTE